MKLRSSVFCMVAESVASGLIWQAPGVRSDNLNQRCLEEKRSTRLRDATARQTPRSEFRIGHCNQVKLESRKCGRRCRFNSSLFFLFLLSLFWAQHSSAQPRSEEHTSELQS